MFRQSPAAGRAPVHNRRPAADRTTAVTGKTGERLSADFVVSNADVVHTYHRLLKGSDIAAVRGERLTGMRHGMSMFVAYFGTRRTYPNVAHDIVLFGPRDRGLLDDTFSTGKLANDFSVYLHAPVPHLGLAELNWSTVGPRYADRIVESREPVLWQRAAGLPGVVNSVKATGHR